MSLSPRSHAGIVIACLTLGACAAPPDDHAAKATPRAASSAHAAEDPGPRPADIADSLRPWLGLYAEGAARVLVGEERGRLRVVLDSGAARLGVASRDTLRLDAPPGAATASPAVVSLVAVRDARRRVTAIIRDGAPLRLVALGPESGNQLVTTPVRPVAELRRQALAATPPAETGRTAAVELVELVRLDSTIRLEVRYATSNNLFGTPFYSQARAFLQKPAAEALARASAWLRPRGLGLLVHDGYRPWYVTRMFWDAAAPSVRPFVADPQKGSKHNRGAAVDIALYDLATGATVPMPSTYDETTERAFADWLGGTSRERWARAMLRTALEREGFVVNPTEWWHFDFTGWERWPILNQPFERLGAVMAPTSP